jgi:hypothetical protein
MSTRTIGLCARSVTLAMDLARSVSVSRAPHTHGASRTASQSHRGSSLVAGVLLASGAHRGCSFAAIVIKSEESGCTEYTSTRYSFTAGINRYPFAIAVQLRGCPVVPPRPIRSGYFQPPQRSGENGARFRHTVTFHPEHEPWQAPGSSVARTARSGGRLC